MYHAPLVTAKTYLNEFDCSSLRTFSRVSTSQLAVVRPRECLTDTQRFKEVEGSENFQLLALNVSCVLKF